MTDGALPGVGPNILDLQRWSASAACKKECDAGRADPVWWFPDRGEAMGPHAETARAICRGCDVRAECLEWAVTHFESGIWGGVGDRRRRDIRSERRIVRCPECDEVFVSLTRRPGETFCIPCRVERERARKRAWEDAKLGRTPGTRPAASIDGGHGTISRYNDGCRCNACRKASREHRQRFDRAS